MGLNAASRTFNIPKPTLKRHLDDKNKYAKNGRTYSGHPQVLSEELESLLVQHIINLDAMLFGITRQDLRSLAFQLAEKNGLPHAFNATKMMAGDHWYYTFLKKRHPELSLRQPEATSIARACGFNRKAISDFFDLLEDVIDKSKLTGARIFNMDESGLTSVQKPGKVLSVKGKKQVGGLTSGERGSTTTIVCCVSGAGQYVPPMMIFRRIRMAQVLGEGAPEGCLVTNNKSGWMDSDMFIQWLKHFKANVGPTKEHPVLLILDGHSSHTKNLEAIHFARENGIVMLTLPPHTTYRLQPLDRTFFKPLMGNYNTACDQWMRNHAGRQITIYQIAALFREAYVKSATMSNAVSGFTTTGIWPCNRSVFTDSDFVAADHFNTSSTPPSPDATRNPLTTTATTPDVSRDPLTTTATTPDVTRDPLTTTATTTDVT